MGKGEEKHKNARDSAAQTKFLNTRAQAFKHLKEDHAAKALAVPGPQGTGDKPLSLNNLNDITSVVDGKDMAQVDSEAYFNDNIVYFMNDDYRKNLLGKPEKPTLSAGLKAIVNDDDVKKWYVDISVPWIALGLNGVNGFKVNSPIIQADMTVLFQKVYYLDQSNLLYHYSFANRVPDIMAYIEDGGQKWADAYLQYIFDNVLSSWIQTITFLQPEIVNLMMKQWVSKLDLLDPSGDSSRELNQKLSVALMANQVFRDINNVSQTKLFGSILKKALNDAKDSSENQDIINNMKTLLRQFNDASFVTGELSVAYSRLDYNKIIVAATVDEVGVLIEEAGALTWTEKFKNGLSSLGSSVRQNLLGTIFMAVSTLAFAMGIANWKVSDNVTRAKTVLSAVSALISFSTTTLGAGLYKAVAWIGNKFLSGLLYLARDGILSSPLKYIGEVVASLFGKLTTSFISKVAVPIFMVASVGFLIYDMVQDAKTDSWGAFSMDMIAALATIGYMVTATLISTSWSGPLSIVFAVIAGLATLAKMFLFKPKTPLQQFQNSLPKRYTNTSLEIYQLPDSITNLTYLTYDNKFVSPDGSPSNKLGKTSSRNYKDPFQVLQVQDTGLVTILNPFNSLSSTPASYLSSRTDDLTLYSYDKGPALETETWILIKASKDSFYILGSDNKYIDIKNGGDVYLSKDNHQEFKFTSEIDWLDLDNPGSALLLNETLSMNGYIANKKYGLALVPDGAFIIDMPDNVGDDFNVARYIKDNSNKIIYKLIDPESKLPDDAVLELKSDGLPWIVDGDKTHTAKLDKEDENGQKFSDMRAFVWPASSDYDYKCKVVDEQYRIVYHS